MVALGTWIYLFVSVAIIGLHTSLILGAPIGYMTMGGRNPGVLPPNARVASALQIILVIWLACVVVEHAGLLSTWLVPDQPWLIWIAVTVGGVSFVLNSITPSIRERLFGAPAGLGLFLGSLAVALGG